LSSYDTQATALAWDSSRNIVYVGLDSGMILGYELNLETTKMTLSAELNGI
jgi:hypothetical protein